MGWLPTWGATIGGVNRNGAMRFGDDAAAAGASKPGCFGPGLSVSCGCPKPNCENAGSGVAATAVGPNGPAAVNAFGHGETSTPL